MLLYPCSITAQCNVGHKNINSLASYKKSLNNLDHDSRRQISGYYDLLFEGICQVEEWSVWTKGKIKPEYTNLRDRHSGTHISYNLNGRA